MNFQFYIEATIRQSGSIDLPHNTTAEEAETIIKQRIKGCDIELDIESAEITVDAIRN